MWEQFKADVLTSDKDLLLVGNNSVNEERVKLVDYQDNFMWGFKGRFMLRSYMEIKFDQYYFVQSLKLFSTV